MWLKKNTPAHPKGNTALYVILFSCYDESSNINTDDCFSLLTVVEDSRELEIRTPGRAGYGTFLIS